jgi:hypothetical protein
VQRESDKLQLEITPDAEGRIGVSSTMHSRNASARAVVTAALVPAQVMSKTISTLWNIAIGRQQRELMGPVAIVRKAAEAPQPRAVLWLRIGALQAASQLLWVLLADLIVVLAYLWDRRATHLGVVRK